MTLGAALRREVSAGFEAQARQHGAELGKRAAEMRARDPLAVQLLAYKGGTTQPESQMKTLYAHELPVKSLPWGKPGGGYFLAEAS